MINLYSARKNYLLAFEVIALLLLQLGCVSKEKTLPVEIDGVVEINGAALPSRYWGIEWSPKGDQAAVSEVIASGEVAIPRLDIKILSVDFTEVKFEEEFNGGDISWSPDGKYLLYTRHTSGNNYAILMLDPSSQSITTIMEDVSICQVGFIPNSELIFILPCKQQGPTPYLRLLNLSTKTETHFLLPDYMMDIASIAVSPNGDRVLIVVGDDKLRPLYLISLISNQANLLTSNSSEYIAHPTWSPDEKLIAYTEGVGSQTRLVVQDLMGSCPASTLALSGIVEDINWHPDGQRIFVVLITDSYHLLSIDVAKVFGDTLKCASSN